MRNSLELTAFDVIAHINGLVHQGEDIYIQESTGKKFIRTPFGFQTTNQLNNWELIRKSAAIDNFLKSQKLSYHPHTGDIAPLSKRSKIRKQLCQLLESSLTDSEKINLTLRYLKQLNT